MWDTTNPNDGDVWGNRPSNAWGDLADTNAHGNGPLDAFGNHESLADTGDTVFNFLDFLFG